MTGRVAPLALALLAVTAWAVSLGVLSGRPELFAVALPIVLVLATIARRAPLPAYSIAHEISSDRVFEGGAVTVTVTVAAGSPIALIELLAPLPPGSAVLAGAIAP